MGPRALQPCAPWVFSPHRAALSASFLPPCPPLSEWGQACMGQVPPQGASSASCALRPRPAWVHLFSTCQSPYLPDPLPDSPPSPGRPLELCRPRSGVQGPIQICQVSLETSLETSHLRKEEQLSASHWEGRRLLLRPAHAMRLPVLSRVLPPASGSSCASRPEAVSLGGESRPPRKSWRARPCSAPPASLPRTEPWSRRSSYTRIYSTGAQCC